MLPLDITQPFSLLGCALLKGLRCARVLERARRVQRRRRAASRAAGCARLAWLTLFWAVWQRLSRERLAARVVLQ